MLYLAIGILGATVMPHNLYLHSALLKKDPDTPDSEKKESILYSAIDSCTALTFAFFVNAAILIVAAAIFYERKLYHVAEIQDAYYLLTPLLSTSVASFVFALALLISGQNSTLTGHLSRPDNFRRIHQYLNRSLGSPAHWPNYYHHSGHHWHYHFWRMLFIEHDDFQSDYFEPSTAFCSISSHSVHEQFRYYGKFHKFKNN